MTLCDICDIPVLETARGLIYVGKTGELESYLCDNCYKGFGHFHRDIKLLRAAADYLDLHYLATKERNYEIS